MSSIDFKNALEARLLELAVAAVGSTSGLNPYVQTFDDHLDDIPITSMPFVVAFATTDELEAAEVAPYGSHKWSAMMYYLDTTQPGETWATGKARRDLIVGTLHDIFEANKFLADSTGPLSVISSSGVKEYVWLSQVDRVTFDGSGQEQYYTFVSEMYFSIHTAKNK